MKKTGITELNLFKDNFAIIDISPPIHEQTAVWPGDKKFQKKTTASLNQGSSVELSEISTTLHIGAHADAPCHYEALSESIEEVPLSPYIGPCQVISLKLKPKERILPDHIKTEIRAPRILFHTNSFPNPNHFTKDFNSLSKDLITYLAEKNVSLIGIDTPSVDPFDDKVLESHHELKKYNIRNLEGLVLEGLRDGIYFISALPLALEGADASPVRAVLLDLYQQENLTK